MEMAGAALGLAAIDFLGIGLGLTVIGNESQVDGHPQALAPARVSEDARQRRRQGTTDAALQLGERGQGGAQGFVQRVVAGRIAESPAGGGNRGQASSGKEKDMADDGGCGLRTVVLEAKV